MPTNVIDPLGVWMEPVRARLPGAVPEAIEVELENAINEFLQTSTVWRHEETKTITETRPGSETAEAVYAINPVTLDIIGEGGVQFGGARGLYTLAVKLPDGRTVIPIDHKPYATLNAYSAPQAVWCPTPSSIELLPNPAQSLIGDTFVILTSLVLKRPIQTVPDLLRDFYFEGVFDGALGRLCGHVKRPYSDPNLAAYHMKRFRNAMRVAKDEANRRWSTAESSWVFPESWTYRPRLRISR